MDLKVPWMADPAATLMAVAEVVLVPVDSTMAAGLTWKTLGLDTP